MKKHLLVCLLMLGTLPYQAFATGMPVFDLSSFTQLIAIFQKAKEQVEQLRGQLKYLERLKEQSKQQSNYLKNLQGNFGYGNLFNDVNFLRRRQWSNDSWMDVLNESVSRGSSAFVSAQKKYDQLYPVRAANEILTTRHKNTLRRTHYQQSSKISRSALAASSYSYDQINDHIKTLHEMLAKLETKTSEKAAIDLTARLVAELGFIQLELLRQQNIQTQLLATQTQGEVNGMSEESQFVTWHQS